MQQQQQQHPQKQHWDNLQLHQHHSSTAMDQCMKHNTP
jgi:hypothetical protein